MITVLFYYSNVFYMIYIQNIKGLIISISSYPKCKQMHKIKSSDPKALAEWRSRMTEHNGVN